MDFKFQRFLAVILWAGFSNFRNVVLKRVLVPLIIHRFKYNIYQAQLLVSSVAREFPDESSRDLFKPFVKFREV